MTQPILGTTRIAFSPVNDTALGLDVDNVMAFLGSSDIRPLTSSDTLEFALSYSSHGLEDSELPLSIAVDGTSQSRSLGSIALMDCKMKDKFQSVRVKSPVKNMKGLPFAIRPRALSVRSLGPNWVFGLAHVFSIRPGGSKYAKLQQIGESGIGIPADVGLKNYPNPFNPSTIIRFELPRSSQVKLSVFDMLGREVSMLVNDKREAGIHEVQFDGSQLASGVYLYRLQADEVVQTRKLILLK
jgi:hypothetical protein